MFPFGDLNGDYTVTVADRTIFDNIKTGGNNEKYNILGDVDLDGDLDATDRSIMSTYYLGLTGGSNVLSVDEIANDIGYAAYIFNDESQNYHVRNREYSPQLGRFLQRDLLEYPDGYNLYQYVMSNPIGYIDPFGFAPPILLEEEHENIYPTIYQITNPESGEEKLWFWNSETKQMERFSPSGEGDGFTYGDFLRILGAACGGVAAIAALAEAPILAAILAICGAIFSIGDLIYEYYYKRLLWQRILVPLWRMWHKDYLRWRYIIWPLTKEFTRPTWQPAWEWVKEKTKPIREDPGGPDLPSEDYYFYDPFRRYPGSRHDP